MKIPSFSRLFRRAKQSAGWCAVCISSSGVHAAHLSLSGDKPRVLKCALHPTDHVTAESLEGLRKSMRVAGLQFTTLLAPGEYQMLLVDAPNVPLEEMRTAIRWRIKDSLDFHVDDATIDVLRIPANKAAGERPQMLYAIAAPNSTIQQCIVLFEKAKFDLNVIEIPEMAQRNIAALFEESGYGLALLAFDDNGGLLTFTSGGELYLARRIDITLAQLQDTNESLRQQSAERLELELQRSMDYFGRQHSYIAVGKLLVCAPQPLGLVALLAANLEVPVEQLDLAQVMDISAAPELKESAYVAQMFYTLGAALRQERRAL